MDFDFTLEGENLPRRAFRARVVGLAVRVHSHGRDYPIRDISATGLALLDETRGFRQGESLVVDLEIHRKAFLKDLPAKVIRVLENGIVGLDFMQLDLKAEERLDKLVLEIQKRLIDLRKARDLARQQIETPDAEPDADRDRTHQKDESNS
ncbi:MAG: PilZ domain-containing protein [Desulfovibrio sp.]|nr:PilZ domain-containing protein [Desulfovibrio sp.]